MASAAPATSMAGERGSPLRSPSLRIALLVIFAFWLAAGAAVAIDPYDLYPWGVRVKLRSNYEPARAEYLAAMAARDPQADVIVVGSSTAFLYTPEVIRSAFPGARDVWNLSYSGARPVDRDQLLRTIAAKSRAPRVIVMLDYIYSADPRMRAPDFPGYLYDGNPFNDLRMINARLPGVLRSTVRSGQPFATGRAVERRIAKNFAQDYAVSRKPSERARWRAAIERRKRGIDRPGRTRCSELGPFTRQLLPVLRELDDRGVHVDLFVPPYSPLMYYTFVDDPAHLQVAGRSFLEDQLLLRRCAVTETAGLASVAVWAPDRDLGLIANIDHFKDPGHLAWGKLGQDTLKRIGDPHYRLTIANVDEYVARMRALVVNYRLPEPGSGTGRKHDS